ncbi:MAG TPA: methyl-accepting chemotaxis protein [Candidatus Methylomirabilis sp.]
MKVNHKRKQFVGDKFQARLLAFSFGYIVIFALLIAVSLFLPAILKLQDATLSVAEKGRAAEEFLSIDERFWPSALVVLVLIGAHSVLVSHRIAGPLVGFRRVLKVVEEGDLSIRAKIRRADYLERDAESINAMISGLSGRLREVQEEFGKTYATWTEVRRKLSEAPAVEAAGSLENLGAQMEALKARIGQFTLGA